MKRHGEIRKWRNFENHRIGEELRAWRNEYVEFAGKRQRLVTCGIDGRRRCREWTRYVDRGKVQRLGSKRVRHVNAQCGAADGQVEDLAHGGIAQVIVRQFILGLWDLLRRTPGGHPDFLSGGSRQGQFERSEG
jgi:hypothetical protein